jgi:hypothetical protein
MHVVHINHSRGKQHMADIRFEDHGSVWVAEMLTDEARYWVDEHVDAPDWAWQGPDRFAGDWRPMRTLAQAMEGAGLEVAQ